jgi:hypothetical protein
MTGAGAKQSAAAANGSDYFRPRGDITTVLDLTNRDVQDNYMFPLDTNNTFFHRSHTDDSNSRVIHPTSLSIQEFTQRGPAEWGQRFTFEIGALPAGDLLQSVILQFRLGHWYDSNTIKKLQTGSWIADTSGNASAYYTYINSLGSSIIEYAEFVVKDQTIEKIDGEFIRIISNLYSDINMQYGTGTDGYGNSSYYLLNGSTVFDTQLNPNRPWPTENGIFFCVLPFFFLRTKLKETFPLLSCNSGDVRINIKLRKFSDVVRNYSGFRQTCDDVPLGKIVPFIDLEHNNEIVYASTSENVPIFQDFRIVTACPLVTGIVRNAYLRKPFEQMFKFVKEYIFDEPLKYIVSKSNANSDTIDIMLPLEFNHPVCELLWVFRRKAVEINNEWSNFLPIVSSQVHPERIYPGWLDRATIRINGSEVISADGEWFREHISSVHKGGWVSWANYIYGYSFAKYPGEHQPSGSANLSRTNSVTINMRINTPYLVSGEKLGKFSDIVSLGWEVRVYAIHMNWLRFNNGVCNKLFED